MNFICGRGGASPKTINVSSLSSTIGTILTMVGSRSPAKDSILVEANKLPNTSFAADFEEAADVPEAVARVDRGLLRQKRLVFLNLAVAAAAAVPVARGRRLLSETLLRIGLGNPSSRQLPAARKPKRSTAEAHASKQVFVDIVPYYRGAAMRPYLVTVRWFVDGERHSHDFPNERSDGSAER